MVTNNKEWKKNRNLYLVLLLDMILNGRFENPFHKFPPDGHIPTISKCVVKSMLSSKFHDLIEKGSEQFVTDCGGYEDSAPKEDEKLKKDLIAHCNEIKNAIGILSQEISERQKEKAQLEFKLKEVQDLISGMGNK